MAANISQINSDLSASKEESFSSIKYFTIALATAAIAAVVFSVCLPVAIGFIAITSWYLWSATIIQLNQAAIGSVLEQPMHRLHAMAMEINSGIAAAALFPYTLCNRYHGPHGQSDGQPILMVNGYLSFGSTWHTQRQKLVQAGFGPIYTMNVGTGKSIITYAKQIQEKVRNIQEKTGKNDLILIGHSKGGLVSSYYATHLAALTNAHITDVVTIGSPLAGTALASLAPGYDAQEMRSDAPFHRVLRQDIAAHPEIRFWQIASEADEVVPLSSALLEQNSSRQLVLKDMGHLGLVFSSRVADQICTWLSRPLP